MKKLVLNILFTVFCCCSATAQDSTEQYVRIVTPIHFDRSVIKSILSLDADPDSSINKTLLNAYLRHPQQVEENTDLRVLGLVHPQVGKTELAKPTGEKNTNQEVLIAPEADVDIAPVDLVVNKPNFWTVNGEYFLQIMQNYYSDNWYQGGESNLSGLTRVTMDFNYNNKQKVKFENRLELNLGLQTFADDSIHKTRSTSDLIRLTNRLGLQASKKWYYTIQSVTTTQFCKSYPSNSTELNSAFLSPLTWNLSVGMDYKISWFRGHLTGNAHFAPFAVNLTHVKRDELIEKNGLDPGKHNLWQLGPNLNIETTWKLSDIFEWKSRIYGFTSFHRQDVEWENTINLKLSRFISASIYIYPKFDDSSTRDDKWGYFQMKEFTSLGLTYSF